MGRLEAMRQDVQGISHEEVRVKTDISDSFLERPPQTMIDAGIADILRVLVCWAYHMATGRGLNKPIEMRVNSRYSKCDLQ